MLEIPEEPDEMFGSHADWDEGDITYLLREVAKTIYEESPGGFMTAFAANIALAAHTHGFTDECGEIILGEIVGIVSHFLTIREDTGSKVHPRIRRTMDAIWEAASWVGNEKLDEAA